MGVTKYYEIYCDQCGSACHYLIGAKGWKAHAREDGWIISKYGDFDSKECKNEFITNLKENK